MLVVIYMVELKHDDVRFPTVYAGVGFKVSVYIGTDTAPGSFAVLFGFGNNLIAMLRVVPTARFPTLFYITERHGWGVYDEYYKIKTPWALCVKVPLTGGLPECALSRWWLAEKIGGGGLWFRIPMGVFLGVSGKLCRLLCI